MVKPFWNPQEGLGWLVGQCVHVCGRGAGGRGRRRLTGIATRYQHDEAANMVGTAPCMAMSCPNLCLLVCVFVAGFHIGICRAPHLVSCGALGCDLSQGVGRGEWACVSRYQHLRPPISQPSCLKLVPACLCACMHAGGPGSSCAATARPKCVHACGSRGGGGEEMVESQF